MTSGVTIRSLTTISELTEVNKLEAEVWKTTAIPVHQTLTAIKNGGIMLGAFINDQLVGFNYGFPGIKNGRLHLCSHTMGIHEGYRSKGIGRLLKLKQRGTALAMGYRLITWTFDPLESPNAYLNLQKLRGIGANYIENIYGKVEDALNAGLPTDRFQVEWWIDSPHVTEHHSFRQSIQLSHDKTVIDPFINSQGLPELIDERNVVDFTIKNQWFVPIPWSIQHIKNVDNGLAVDWRMKTREIFSSLISNGFVATGIKRLEENQVHYYIFEKRDSLQINDDRGVL